MNAKTLLADENSNMFSLVFALLNDASTMDKTLLLPSASMRSFSLLCVPAALVPEIRRGSAE